MAETPSRLDWPRLLEEALTAPGNVGDTYSRFYRYSFLNQMYLRLQGVHEPVATYKRWRALGRQVLRGAVAKEIITPVVVTMESADADDGERERLIGFKPVRCIFGVSDTAGQDLPPYQPPGWDRQTAYQQLGIREVPFASLNGNMQGYSHGLELAINPVAINPNKTRFHEIGHIILGHTMPHSFPEYQHHKGIYEFQAESTAYLTMNELGILDDDTASRSRGYIQDWLDGEPPPDKAIQRVFTATDRILRAGRLAVADGPETTGT